MNPYASRRYALGLAHAGRTIDVPEWRTHVLARDIPCGGEDGLGVYPLTPLSPAADLTGGLERLKAEALVSIVLVPDPLIGPSIEALGAAFDVARPFKAHLTVDPAAYAPNRHHRQEIRRAHRRCRVEVGPLAPWLPDWVRLYQELVARHDIAGVADFSVASFQALAEEPLILAFAAFVDDRIVGMALWFEHDGVVYNHLAASDAVGYANGASYALYDTAIVHFAGAAVINLGGGAGAGDDAEQSGLYAFKQGFANGEVKAWLCGAVLDADRYERLSAGRGGGFFPAYRGLMTTTD